MEYFWRNNLAEIKMNKSLYIKISIGAYLLNN